MSRRLTNKEADKSIFKPRNAPKKKTVATKTKSDSDVVAYTSRGKENYLDDGKPVIENINSPNAYAKRDGARFFVKSSSGILFDHNSLYSQDKYKKIGDESAWKWVEVSPKVFNLYTEYLATGNRVHYLIASREII